MFSGSADPAEEKKGEDKAEPIVLSKEAQEKVEKAYVVETVELTEEEVAVMKAVSKGDYSALEQDWDTFQVKASVPGDGDDDDDDDDEDDDEEDEDEEEKEEDEEVEDEE